MRRFVLLLLVVTATSTKVHSQPVGETLRDLDGHFPMQVPSTLEQWQTQAMQLRRQVQVALALHPMPALATTAPTIHSRVEMDGYTVEKIYFESLPGFYVTGSLYRPTISNDTPHPAVLYAHGHWENGRFYECSPGEVRRLLATGAERFEAAAINHMQAACVQLARMGCVALQYDMIGYADSQQISFDRAHRYGIGNILNVPEEGADWMLFSANAEGYGQSIMALQAINSLRAFDVVSRLPDVDPKRIAITGASGGGTQSFITSAVEPRLAGAFPAVMVSTGMQGGCTCENACGLRVGAGNIEITALSAPRPMGMTTANDWTLKMPEDGFPELRKLYALFGKENAVELYPGPQFPHNYNHISRVAMYGWANRLFGLGLEEPILERDFDRLGSDQLTVWDDSHQRPDSGIEFEQRLTKSWAEAIDSAIQLHDGDAKETQEANRAYLRDGWEAITLPAVKVADSLVATDYEDHSMQISSLAGTTVGRWEPLNPKNSANQKPERIEMIVAARLPVSGKVWPKLQTLDAFAKLSASRVVTNGSSTMSYLCGINDRFVESGPEQRLVPNPRPAAAFTYGYNPPQLVRELGALVRVVREVTEAHGKPVSLIVRPEDAFLGSAARLLLPEQVMEVVVMGSREQVAGKFRRVRSIRDNDFVPASLRYQDMDGLLSVAGEESIQFVTK